MTKPLAYATLLLATSTLVAPAALAQVAGGQTTTTPPATSTVNPGSEAPVDAPVDEAGVPEEDVEISVPGASPGAGDIVVTGRNIPNVVRATPQVLSVLSTADIARTGEGDIAGALQRVTGLSVVGPGFVFVRGLGDRYSSSLLNGSPLPSPEPLRRTVPLDIFPTSIVGSALVQKSYSVNYPGEFGGGVINLTTRAIPDEDFITIGGSILFDTETTARLGYTYYGSDLDWLGYDDGARDVPDWVTDIGQNGSTVPTAQVAELTNAATTLLQSNHDIPPNFSGEINLGKSWDIGDDRLGVIASASVSNGWRTRDAIQQDTNTLTGNLRSDFRTVITDNRIVANGLVGLGYEFGEQQVRWTNVYIHDTLKQGRASTATLYPNTSGFAQFVQNTNWFERQLFTTQLVGEFEFDQLSVDVRGSYANSKRNSPYERQFRYRFDPVLGIFVNNLNASNESASIAFSELDEDLWSGQADLSYELGTAMPVTLSAGYYYSDSDRISSRYTFAYDTSTGGALPTPYSYLRPDHLLSPDVLFDACADPDGCIVLNNTSGGSAASLYDASLRIHGAYLQAEVEVMDGLRAQIGVRYEDGQERVGTMVPVGAAPVSDTLLENDYWLPAATITWNFAEDMQLRLHGSKTIARPQFRELAPQFYQDFESDRLFFGNPFLQDSELLNFEARYEWFFARGQRVTAAAFYKKIDRPIEQVSAFPTLDSRLTTGFSFVPDAELYGAEIEIQKYFPLDTLGGDFFATRRLLVVANYTYTQSSINADETCVPNVGGGTIPPCESGFARAQDQFRDGAPLTGQSDHIANLQFGIEDTDKISQATILLSYASERVTARGASDASGTPGLFLPDVKEKPGFRLDFVAREELDFLNTPVELKFEVRNITGTKYQEFQEFEDSRVFINRYDVGTTFSLGASVTF